MKSITAENNTQTDNLFKAYFRHLKMLDFVVYNSQSEILYCYLHGLINHLLFSQHLHLETKHLSLYYYRPQRSCEGYVFTPVFLSTGVEGGLPQCMLGYHPAPGPGIPRDQTPLPPGPDTTPLPEQAPPGAGTPQQTATVADGTHPTGMHSCYRNCVSSIWILVICIPQRQASDPFSAILKD